MTTRLYYDDPYLSAFDATVTSVEPRGEAVAVTLDRTAFYPTSGGQPSDTGTLGGFRVIDVVDREDGAIEHVIDRSAEASRSAPHRTAGMEREASAERTLAVGDTVHGDIDFARRFDHMQQHTGQHVLSAAFEHLFHVRTVSFHLGTDVSTIDLARDVTQAELTAAEQDANRIVWEDRPVGIRYATEAEAAALPLRKESKRGGTLRLIDVADYDLSACGGTHVARTGAIGVISIASWERFKGGVRLEFVCGGRALARFRALRDTVAAATRLLSASAADLPQTIERLQADAKDQKRAVTALQTELARFRADELAAAAAPIQLHDGSSVRLVAQALDADANTLKSLASAITSRAGLVAVLITRATPALVVVARSADVAGVNAQQVLARLVTQFGGRGGGKAELAQGGGLNGSIDQILNASATVL
ncbi:MAG TPA: DHHA1 domain-containing protein [Vicinamibacterales bacterium]|nr:DHHA1 domain-containing protein [Vicinamibacterales bacterium]